MPNWDKTPPICGMSIEEIKKRVAAGIKNRQKSGQLRDPNLKEIETKLDGPGFTKKQRRVMIQAANLAIYGLANGDAQDYCHACDAMNACRRQAGFPTTLLQHMLKDVAELAAELRGEDFQLVDQIARQWLVEHFTPSATVISIAKGKANGNAKD